MTIGLPDPRLSYPGEQALYPVSVRHNKCLPTASFRFLVTQNTLAFGYEIPAITALSGLEAFCPAPFRYTTCPAHQSEGSYGEKPGLMLKTSRFQVPGFRFEITTL